MKVLGFFLVGRVYRQSGGLKSGKYMGEGELLIVTNRFLLAIKKLQYINTKCH